ncbi:MAG: hypothetical protein A3J48_00835 [Candidatus Doudnabacteria bacterium RIFCSPHIGHO2_02_FULL_46_11]|uniref:Homing endonuclease LAGLIDADG domain-containing protein n=1 Tax=Candidatus Doudnabacteria bacterium RIFCSPHIGHO2_02_FULL_46_11 TaxID=1817832 RepID=A0A1F5P8X1_9BACT|nr:MAG: hypothetical protein A3J48_00835 [Candidatus Doudnabacteria bacterium RIFCSPHIGHO2_02_FULL_46_11]
MSKIKALRSQLSHSKSKLNGLGRRTKPIISADYITGLTDGEGCFYVLVRPPYNHSGGALVQLKFFIKMQAQDKKLLDEVQKFLGCGAVYFQHETRANHAQCYRYTVHSYRDIMGTIIPFFLEHALHTQSKQKSFAIFCKIAELVSKGEHHHQKGIELIKQLKSQMNHRTRVVRESRTLRGNAKYAQLSQSARHTMEVGSS